MRRRALIGGGAVLAAAAAAAVATGAGGEDPAPEAEQAAGTTSTVAVERRDLVDRRTVSGTLGYAEPGTLPAGTSGTLTAMRAEGAVVTRGHSLYELDGRRTGWLLYGTRPAWRDFTPGMADGADVRQLEANLRELGHDPDRAMTIDDDWTAATTAAVRRFQDARGLTEDGSLGRGEVLFRPGAVRLGAAKAEAGRQVQPGMELAALGSLAREVAVDLRADEQQVAEAGARVVVTLPDGREVRGRVAEVGKVAEPGGAGEEPTIPVRITLSGRAAKLSGLDQAPVDVAFESERADDVLAVPVTALIALAGGGYGVETDDGGTRRTIEVEVGLFTDDDVEVRGSGLREGLEVVVPA